MLRFAVIMPNQTNAGTGQGLVQRLLNTMLSAAAKAFGGASTSAVRGAWVMPDGSLCTEDSTEVWTLVPEDKQDEARDFFRFWGDTIKTALEQDAVLITCQKIEAQFI